MLPGFQEEDLKTCSYLGDLGLEMLKAHLGSASLGYGQKSARSTLPLKSGWSYTPQGKVEESPKE